MATPTTPKGSGISPPSTNTPEVTATTNDASTAEIGSRDNLEHKCATRGTLATQRCSACAEGVDLHGGRLQTFYCSAKCQRENWIAHKVQCCAAIDRRQLFRIGAITQWAFYEISKSVWYQGVIKVTEQQQQDSDDEASLLV